MTIDENGVEKEFSTKDAFNNDGAGNQIQLNAAPVETAEQAEHEKQE